MAARGTGRTVRAPAVVRDGWVPFDKYHELVLEVLALRREGFATPPQLMEPAAAPSLPDAVTKAVAEIAAGNPPLERTLIETAWGLLKQGHDESEVAQMIRDGEPVEL